MACKKERAKDFTVTLGLTSEEYIRKEHERLNEQFSKTFTSIVQGYNKLGKEIENTRIIMNSWNPETAYAYALHIHEEAEKITLNARRLPCYLGMRDAEERVRREMEKIVPH